MKQMTKIAAVVLATFGVVAVGAATTADTASTESHHHFHGPGPHGMHGEFAGGGFMAALRQLNLTDQQKQSIKSILSSAHPQAPAPNSSEFTALNNPGDPNYAQAVRDAQTAAADRIQQRSNVEQQVYNLLTAEQKAQLPKVLADMQAKFEQRRADWQQRHESSSSTTSK